MNAFPFCGVGSWASPPATAGGREGAADPRGARGDLPAPPPATVTRTAAKGRMQNVEESLFVENVPSRRYVEKWTAIDLLPDY